MEAYRAVSNVPMTWQVKYREKTLAWGIMHELALCILVKFLNLRSRISNGTEF